MSVGDISSKPWCRRTCGNCPVPCEEVPPGALLQPGALPPAERWGLRLEEKNQLQRCSSLPQGCCWGCRSYRPAKAWNDLAGGKPSNAYQSDDKFKLRGLFSHPQCLSVKKTDSDTAPPQPPLIFRGSDKLSSASAEIQRGSTCQFSSEVDSISMFFT